MTAARRREYDPFVHRVLAGVVLLSAPLGLVACKGGAAASAPIDAGDAAISAAVPIVARPDAGAPAASGSAKGAIAASLHARSMAQRGGETIAIPAGTVRVGSTPGDEGRDPTLEPIAFDVALGAFAIDALPYPNDPHEPPRRAASRDEAEHLCAERGARLCTEIEWERACKGPDDDAFATGTAWDPECDRDPTSCTSGFGVRALGTLREWTTSRVATVRGAGRRCAQRARPSDPRGAATVGFRCCHEAPNDAEIPPIADHPRAAFRPATVDPSELAAIFATVPELARLGRDLRFIDEGEARGVVGHTLRAGATITTTPIFWSPEAGSELLVSAGRAEGSSFIVALWWTGGAGPAAHRVASSFVFQGEKPAVVLAFDPSRRAEITWTTCGGCRGEEGTLRLKPDHSIVIQN